MALKISVIIPTFNVENYIRQAVESVVETGYPNLEIIIVDDGSKDNTIQISHKLMDKYSNLIKLHQHPGRKNMGAGATRNLGIMKASGEVIAFLDADDWYLPNRFDTALPVLESQHSVDGVYEYTGIKFEQKIDKLKFHKKSGLIGIEVDSSYSLISKLSSGRCWHINALTVRKSVFARSGLFDPALLRGQDIELFIRIACVAQLVLGNKIEPVAMYRRYFGNRSMPGRTEEMIKVVSHAFRWSHSNKATKNASQIIMDGFLNSIYYMTFEYIKNGKSVRAFNILWKIGKCFPHLLVSKYYWTTVVRALKFQWNQK